MPEGFNDLVLVLEIAPLPCLFGRLNPAVDSEASRGEPSPQL